jgi:hypothetical protein
MTCHSVMGGEGLTLGTPKDERTKSDLFVRRPRLRSTAGGRATVAMLWLVGCTLVPLLAGGCEYNDGISRVVEITPNRFNSLVLRSEQPVLVNFYKPG